MVLVDSRPRKGGGSHSQGGGDATCGSVDLRNIITDCGSPSLMWGIWGMLVKQASRQAGSIWPQCPNIDTRLLTLLSVGAHSEYVPHLLESAQS